MLAEITVITHEFKHSLNKYLKNDVELNEKIRCLTDVIKFNEVNPPAECYNQNFLECTDSTNGLEDEKYVAAREDCRINAIKYLESLFDENQADALVSPSFSEALPSLYAHGACSGYPTITVRRYMHNFSG